MPKKKRAMRCNPSIVDQVSVHITLQRHIDTLQCERNTLRTQFATTPNVCAIFTSVETPPFLEHNHDFLLHQLWFQAGYSVQKYRALLLAEESVRTQRVYDLCRALVNLTPRIDQQLSLSELTQRPSEKRASKGTARPCSLSRDKISDIRHISSTAACPFVKGEGEGEGKGQGQGLASLFMVRVQTMTAGDAIRIRYKELHRLKDEAIADAARGIHPWRGVVERLLWRESTVLPVIFSLDKTVTRRDADEGAATCSDDGDSGYGDGVDKDSTNVATTQGDGGRYVGEEMQDTDRAEETAEKALDDVSAAAESTYFRRLFYGTQREQKGLAWIEASKWHKEYLYLSSLREQRPAGLSTEQAERYEKLRAGRPYIVREGPTSTEANIGIGGTLLVACLTGYVAHQAVCMIVRALVW
ncbi:hypothetical protein BGZ98_007497 [Dissophora globulifera]|nr:hypothetical protein BGZ98_007497 [Dissophora globulifera]